MADDRLKQFEEVFKEELKGITDVQELKDLFAKEIARRDKIIADLQEQNRLILQSTFKEKSMHINQN